VRWDDGGAAVGSGRVDASLVPLARSLEGLVGCYFCFIYIFFVGEFGFVDERKKKNNLSGKKEKKKKKTMIQSNE
jgi:hypothetical protein